MPKIIYERHSEKRTLYLQKVIKLLKEGRSKAAICRELPISRGTIDNWLKETSCQGIGEDGSDGIQMKSKKSKARSGKEKSAGTPTAAAATVDSGAFAVALDTESGSFTATFNNPSGSMEAKVMELPG